MIIIVRGCSECAHCAFGYLTQFNGQGVYRFAYCQVEISAPVLMDPGALRVCDQYKGKTILRSGGPRL